MSSFRLERPADAESGEPAIDTSPLGFWIAVAGAGAILISVFLPMAATTSYAMITENSLIQSGWGWPFIGAALISLIGLYGAYQGGRSTNAPRIVGVLAVGYAIFLAKSGSVLTLCSVATGGDCSKASPGLGIYLAGLGALMMLAGGGRITTAKADAAAPMTGSSYCRGCGTTMGASAQFCAGCGKAQVA